VAGRPSPGGSLKRYTDIPPVLDRFKKKFLHGTAGKFRDILLGGGWSPRFLLGKVENVGV